MEYFAFSFSPGKRNSDCQADQHRDQKEEQPEDGAVIKSTAEECRGTTRDGKGKDGDGKAEKATI